MDEKVEPWDAESIRRLTVRSYFSIYHLWAARDFAGKARTRESVESLFGAGDDLVHKGYVVGAVIASASFLEATVNELYSDAAADKLQLTGRVNEETRQLMAAYWRNGGNRNPLLNKCQLLLAFAGLAPLDPGRQPYNDAALLLRVRNYLVHYEPEDLSLEDIGPLGRALKARQIAASPLAGGRGRWWPDQALGAGLAEWSWHAALGMSNRITAELGISPRYDRLRDWLKLSPEDLRLGIQPADPPRASQP